MTQAPVSVVIPALDAAATLPGCLEALEEGRRAGLVGEGLVVDGGSADATAALAERAGVRVLQAPRGRGRQLAAGAASAGGPWLLFLHADTRLAPGWGDAVHAFLAAPASEARVGCFRLAFDDASAGARRVAWLANWRARVLGLPYGDQGLLVHKRLYDAVGGYRPLPLMEDVDLLRRLGRRRVRLLPAEAVTSAQRYRSGGWWARPARNLSLLTLYLLGVPPGWLKRLYG